MHRSLPRSTPSAHAVDARGIASFVDALEATPNVEPHSLMILRDGHVLAEGWWSPYSADRVHLLYSVSKSFTATAVAFAAEEGLLSLDDTVLSHFPELDAEVTDSRSRSLRIRHLLAMASGHRDDTLDRALALAGDNLVRGFLLLPPENDPGTVFAYNQPCTYTAGVIVQRATGSSLTEYLRPRLFDPLGIYTVGWTQDGAGFDYGFSGVHATTEAIAAFGQLYLQRGEWNGAQLLPAAWVDNATTVHVANGSDPASDWAQGYGYQFWMSRHGYRGDGAYGQFIAVLPEHGLVLAMTGQSDDMQAILDLAWQHLLPALGFPGETRGDPESDAALAAQLATLALAPLEPGASNARVEGATFTPTDPAASPTITRLLLEPGRDTSQCVLTLVEPDGRIEVPASFGRWNTSDATSASAGWRPGTTHLAVDVIFVETPHRLHLVLDLAAATFETRWETEPLHSPSLSSLRAPRHPGP